MGSVSVFALDFPGTQFACARDYHLQAAHGTSLFSLGTMKFQPSPTLAIRREVVVINGRRITVEYRPLPSPRRKVRRR